MKIKSIYLNLLKDYCYFYDWLEEDQINEYHNIPLFRVSSKTINDLIMCDIKLINNSLIYKNKIIIFTDYYNYIAISFDDRGESALKSSLFFKDEIEITDKYDRLKSIKLSYNIIKKRFFAKESRLNTKIRNIIASEINNMVKKNDYEKIKYIYYEWFNQKNDDINKMVRKMIDKLNIGITEKEYYIYTLLNKSYKAV